VITLPRIIDIRNVVVSIIQRPFSPTCFVVNGTKCRVEQILFFYIEQNVNTSE